MKKRIISALVVALAISVFNIVPFVSISANAATVLLWPVEGHTSLSRNYAQHNNKAIDINDSSINGATIRAALGGTVVTKYTCSHNTSGWSDPYPTCCYGFGTGLFIKGTDGRYYTYAHMQADSIPSDIKKGSTVKQGQIIGKVGKTGNATGPCLHFQINTSERYWDTGFKNPQLETYIYKIDDYQDLGTKFYANILSAKNTKFAVAANDSANVYLATSENIDTQKWLFEKQSDKSYKITNAKYNKCLDVYGGKTDNGTNIQIYKSNNGNSQRWYFVKNGSGYTLVPKCSTGSAMDIKSGTISNGTNIQEYARNTSDAQRFTISKISDYTIAYNANGGSGSIASSKISVNGSLKIAASAFSCNDHTFAGYNVKRNTDNAWYVTGQGWLTDTNINKGGYTKRLYTPGESYTLSGAWTNGAKSGDTFTFYAVWKPNKPQLYFYNNYSGCNYLLGSDLGENYSKYIYGRGKQKLYTLSVDSSQSINHQNSLKIVATGAGSSGEDMAFNTSTNLGRNATDSNGFDYAGDNKTMTLTFWAKGTVDGAKMYFRWGYASSSDYINVTLTKEWKKYSVEMPKNVNLGKTIHPYIDKAGTYWINNLVLCDGSNGTTCFRHEDSDAILLSNSGQEYAAGGTYSTLPTPTRDGYTFLGWFTQTEGGTQITTSTKVNDYNMNVYAHWKKDVTNDYTAITYTSDNKKYELYEDAVTWEEAKVLCEEKGGHLVTINSQEENDLVYDMIKDKTQFAWLGGKLNETTKAWEWVTGEAFDYTNWAANEPTSNGAEFYLQMYSMNVGTDETSGKWNDAHAINTFGSYYSHLNSMYICEYEVPAIGDVNGDGQINISDATAIQLYLAEFNEHDVLDIALADVNQDGKINVADVTEIQRYLAEFIISLQ